MSTYNLIKATSRIMRSDTIHDLFILNQWRITKCLEPMSPKKPSIRSLENAVALGIENLDIVDLPKLVRGLEFYISILPEIKSKER